MSNLKTFMPVCFIADGTFSVDLLYEHVNQGNLESDSKTKITIHGEIWQASHCKKELDAKPFTSLFESNVIKWSDLSLFVL